MFFFSKPEEGRCYSPTHLSPQQGWQGKEPSIQHPLTWDLPPYVESVGAAGQGSQGHPLVGD